MGLTIIRRADTTDLTYQALGLSIGAPVEQVIAAASRRAASVNCPTTPAALTAAVSRSLAPIIDEDDLSGLVMQILERLVAMGDLVESVEERAGVRRTIIYLGGPRFIKRGNGDALLIGVRPDALPIVSDELVDDLEQYGYIRRVAARPELEGLLEDEGLREVKSTRWLRAPEVVSAEEFRAAYDARLKAAGPSGEIEGLRVLDPSTPNTYYRGRWRAPRKEHSGNFVARRGQRFGAELWAYVTVTDGEPVRLLDLPALTPDRGCDEAWQLQAAIDASNNNPQQITVHGTGRGGIGLALYAPPPRWLQRRWELIGQPSKIRGALFAYEFSPADAREELPFATERLWLTRYVAPSEDGE